MTRYPACLFFHRKKAKDRTSLRNLHLTEDPARQVSLDLVLASANGVGLSLVAIRTSQTFMIPSEEADATKNGSSSEFPSILESTTIPFTRAECASSIQYATFPLTVSHAVTFLSSPPVYRSPFCYNLTVISVLEVLITKCQA